MSAFSGPKAIADLHSMADRALEMFPTLAYRGEHVRGVPDRATAALEIVERGEVVSRGTLPFSGHDAWEVSGYKVSVGGKTCNCEDRTAPVDAKLGRLCKHRLAAMFVTKLRRAAIEPLKTLFDISQTLIVLEVRTIYGGTLGRQSTRVMAYRADDDNRLDLEEEIDISMDELRDLLYKTGWRVANRLVVGRHVGGRERWTFERGAGGPNPDEATEIYRLFGRDAATNEDHARERRLGMMFTAGLEAARV